MDVSHIDSILVVPFEVCVQMMKSVRREGFYLFLFQRMRREMRRLRHEMRRLRQECVEGCNIRGGAEYS